MLPVVAIGGEVAPGFEAVRETFAENFRDRRELGGAIGAYARASPVIRGKWRCARRSSRPSRRCYRDGRPPRTSSQGL
jgi:hypothetical protein